MFKVFYSPELGVAYPDFNIKARVLNNFNDPLMSATHVANETYIYALRALVKQGLIPVDQVELYFVNSDESQLQLELNEHGDIEDWPPGFCNTFENLLMEILGW